METRRKLLALAMALHLCALSCLAPSASETPQYTVVHTEGSSSSFEIRLYRASAWMTAPILRQASFQHATYMGAHKLFQYIQGANLNSSRIPLSFPVLTGIIPDSGPFDSSSFTVRFYLPTQFQESPPVPLPELQLQLEYWDSLCVAVRSFSGFALDEIIAKEANILETSLRKSPWANVSMGSDYKGNRDAYTISRYSVSPMKHGARKNEVWVTLNGPFITETCEPVNENDRISTL